MWLMISENLTLNLGAAERITLEDSDLGPPESVLVCAWYNERKHPFWFCDTYHDAVAIKSAIFNLVSGGRRVAYPRDVTRKADEWLQEHPE